MRPARSSCAFFASALLVFIVPLARAQTVTNTRPCSVVEAPGASEVLDTVPESTSLRLRVEDDTDLNYAAIDWRGQAAFVPRTCLSLGFLAPGFEGVSADSLSMLAARLTGSPPAKGEYETTREHEERLAMWRHSVSVGGQPADSSFTVVVPLTSDEVSYDADRALMTVRLSQHSSLGVDAYAQNLGAPSGSWAYTYLGSGSFPKRNARGRIVRGTYPFVSYLAFEVPSYLSREALVEESAFYVPRREAPTAASRIAMALTVRMAPPYLSAGSAVRADGRVETLLGLHSLLERAEVFDVSTGKVYFRATRTRPGAGASTPSQVTFSSSAGTPPPEFVAVERQPVKVFGNDPDYPSILCRAGIEGRVVVRAWVGRDGAVKDVQVLRSDNDGFNENAIAAVRQWRFEPAVQAGNPVDVWMTIPIRFRLNDPSTLDCATGKRQG